MAQRVITQFVDDLDGTEVAGGGTTVCFELDGTAYEIDLGAQNADRLHAVLAPYIEVARRIGGPPDLRRVDITGAGSRTKQETDNIRAWAHAHGYEVNERGRIPAPVVAAYHAAH